MSTSIIPPPFPFPYSISLISLTIPLIIPIPLCSISSSNEFIPPILLQPSLKECRNIFPLYVYVTIELIQISPIQMSILTNSHIRYQCSHSAFATHLVPSPNLQ